MSVIELYQLSSGSKISLPFCGVEGIIRKSDDDTKLGGIVDSLQGHDALPRDLNRLKHWVIINGMKLNKPKYQTLHSV